MVSVWRVQRWGYSPHISYIDQMMVTKIGDLDMTTATDEITTLPASEEERITILTDSFDAAAMEFHRRRMAAKGYRLENRIAGHHFYMTEGMETSKLFDGEVKYAVTFVRDDDMK